MRSNRYLIYFAKRIWQWFWMKLMDGFAPSDKNGSYKRPKGLIPPKNIESDLFQKSNHYLIIGSTCPWSHRTLLLYKLKNLSENLSIIFLKPNFDQGEWIFKERFKGFHSLDNLYKKSKFKSQSRATVPVLIKYKNNKFNIISNESSQILEILNSIKFDNKNNISIKECNFELKDLITNEINDGVYKCGFARNQEAYESASHSLFSALKKVDKMLIHNKGPWICGEDLTYADLYLFPTLIRWELIYSKIFKCTEKEITEFRNIMQWRLNFFNLPGVQKTCYENEWNEDYNKALFPLNPSQIVPIQKPLEQIIFNSLR